MKIKILSNRGFTLVEVIVVLVILAILTSVAVPALTGYIDRASEKAIIVEARQCVIAAQTIATERYVTNSPVNNTIANTPEFKEEVKKLAEVPSDGVINSLTFDNNSVTEQYYTRKDITVHYVNGKYSVVDTIGGGESGEDEGIEPLPPVTQTSFLASFQGLTDAKVEVYQNGVWTPHLGNDNFALIGGLNNVSSSLRVSKGGNAYTFSGVMPNTPDNQTPFVVPLTTIKITNDSKVIGLQVRPAQNDWIYPIESLAESGTIDFTVINNYTQNTRLIYIALTAQGQSRMDVSMPSLPGSIKVSDYTYTIEVPPEVTSLGISQANWIIPANTTNVKSVELLKNGAITTFTYSLNGVPQTPIKINADGTSQPAW